eukprot:gene16359-19462_t
MLQKKKENLLKNGVGLATTTSTTTTEVMATENKVVEEEEEDDTPLFTFSADNDIDEEMRKEIEEQQKLMEEQEESNDQEDVDQDYNGDGPSMMDWTEEDLIAYQQQQQQQIYQGQEQYLEGDENYIQNVIITLEAVDRHIQNSGITEINQSSLLAQDRDRIKELRDKQAALAQTRGGAGGPIRTSSNHKQRNQWTSVIANFHNKKQQLAEKQIDQQTNTRNYARGSSGW